MLKDVLKQSRTKCGFTQEEIAKKVKVAKQTYLKWENGDTEPKASQIRLLSKHLNITADEICSGILYEQYALDEFIIEQRISNAPADIITLRTWQYIKDHNGFIESLKTGNLSYDEMADIHTMPKL